MRRGRWPGSQRLEYLIPFNSSDKIFYMGQQYLRTIAEFSHFIWVRDDFLISRMCSANGSGQEKSSGALESLVAER